MKMLESYSLFSATEYMLKKLNLFGKAKKLGQGTHGVAFYYENKVYKITDDKSEVELAYLLLNEKSRYYVQIFDIFQYDKYWIIIQEYIDISKINKISLQEAITYFDKHTWTNFSYSKDDFDKMIQNYTKEYNFGEEEYNDYFDEELFFIKLIKNLFLDLQKYGIYNVIDIKMNSLGKNKNGELKFFDLRLSGDVKPDISNIKKLN